MPARIRSRRYVLEVVGRDVTVGGTFNAEAWDSGRGDGETLVLHLHDMNNIMFHGRQGSAVFMRTLRHQCSRSRGSCCGSYLLGSVACSLRVSLGVQVPNLEGEIVF